MSVTPGPATPLEYTCYFCSRKFSSNTALDTHWCPIRRTVAALGSAHMWWQGRKRAKQDGGK